MRLLTLGSCGVWRVLIRANSCNSWPVISKNRHEFYEFHEKDHLTVAAGTHRYSHFHSLW